MLLILYFLFTVQYELKEAKKMVESVSESNHRVNNVHWLISYFSFFRTEIKVERRKRWKKKKEVSKEERDL